MNKSKGLIVTSAATGMNLILGVLYIWSIMSKALIKEFNWSTTLASLPYSVSIASFAFIMIFAGRLQDVKGPRVGAILGTFLLGGGLIISGFVKDPYIMTITFGIMGGAGIGFCYAATTPPAVKWFPLEKKGLISGIVVSGVGFAAVYISPLTNSLIGNYGISKTFFVLGVGALIILLLLTPLLIDPPKGYVPNLAGAKNKQSSSSAVEKKQFTYKEMIKTPTFYKLWLMYAFTSMAGLMVIGHLALIAKIQAKWENGFYLVVLLAIFNTLGRIIGGIVSDKFGHIGAMRVIFIAQAVNMFLFSMYLSQSTLAFGAALTGLSYGALFSVFPVATAEYYGTKNMGVNYGIIFTSWGCAGVIGPLLAGKIYDTTGSYSMAYIISAVLLIIAALMTLTFVKNSNPKLKTGH